MWLTRKLKRLLPSPESMSTPAEFLTWRQQFFPGRLHLLAWIVLIVLILVTVLNLTVTIPSLNASGDPKFMFGPDRMRVYLESTISQILGVFVGVLITRSRWMVEAPKQVFLVFNALVLLPPQALAALRGEVSFDGETWLIYFAVQAILVPVHWPLHVISQVVAIGYFVVAFLWGWRDPNVIVGAAYVLTSVYTIFICAVSDAGVFLYERSRRRELELRQQLQVFIHAVSHDLRNPVLGLVMTLKSFVRPSGEAATIPQELLEQMIASGDRQVALINSLLEAQATEQYGLTLHRQTIRLGELVDAIAQDFQPFFQQEKATLINQISPDLPPLQADPLHLRRVYENLIANALKYNPPGLQLTLTAEVIKTTVKHHQSAWGRSGQVLNDHTPARWLHCTISDNGSGLTQQQCDRLFDLYHRGPNKRQTLGLGLGLYMCRQIIKAHEGQIGVTSAPGRGSTFWFTLPL